jgi:hypothetical protein
MATQNVIDAPLFGYSGTGHFAGTTSPSFTTPTLGAAIFTSLQPSANGSGILDSNGFIVIGSYAAAGTPVNSFAISNSATGNPPFIMPVGSDTNIAIQLLGKGTGGVEVQGTSGGGNAPAGYVGEFVSSQVLSTSPVSFTSGTIKNLTSISLTAGDWDVSGNFLGVTTLAFSSVAGWINTASATEPDISFITFLYAVNTAAGSPVPLVRLSLTTTTTVFLICQLTGTGTIVGSGGIYARRVR